MADEILTESGYIYEYPIFDQTNQEITNPDLTKGYLRKEYFTIHHPMIPEVWHYVVKSFEFSNGEIYVVESENDPHVKVIDAEKGVFEYQTLEGEEKRTVVGQTIFSIVDQQMVPASDETQIFYRYILFTEEELADKEFLKNGPRLLVEAQETIEELLLVLAELLGGDEEETEPTDEEPIDEEPTDAEPTDEEPTDAEPTDEEPTDSESTDNDPIDNEPTDEPVIEEGE